MSARLVSGFRRCWARQQLGIPKTHCYDAALQGRDLTTVVSLPSQVLALRPTNGRSKQKANVTATGRPSAGPSGNSSA